MSTTLSHEADVKNQPFRILLPHCFHSVGWASERASSL